MTSTLERKAPRSTGIEAGREIELRIVARPFHTIEVPSFQDEGFRGRMMPSVHVIAALLERKSIARAFLEGNIEEIDADQMMVPALALLVRDAQERLGDGVSLGRILSAPPSGYEGVLYYPMHEHLDDPITEWEEPLWQACVNYIREREGGAQNV